MIYEFTCSACERVIKVQQDAQTVMCACGAIHELQSNHSYKSIEVHESMKPTWKLAPAMVAKGPQGLGDTVENALNKVGGKQIKAAYKAVTGKDCGCEKRKRKLNEIFPYKDTS